ncbi:MAG: ABC transporter permease [Rhodocyclaceae bacterium]|nr:ABC transporter permease [Rhodocyclaceae bacterium]
MNGNALPAPHRDPAGRTVGWWRMLRIAALLLAATLSPAAWTQPTRRAVATQVCLTAMRTLPRFALLSGLLSLVLVHIVVVTAQSYGLTQFALGTVIRVLVVELLPLAAALFIALSGSLAGTPPVDDEEAPDGAAGIPRALLAQVVARAVAVVALATLAGGIALALAYLGVYGFTPWGVAGFTRTVGQVFDPIVLMALGLKTGLFAAAVATIPAACDADGARAGDPTLHGTVRLFAVLVAVEILSLVVEFF